ncbi:hypothetical protein IFM89_011492 [Coptis chinensis]|uniref:ABC transporter domain-containing protein n=1 Tax=Coptis chinensis TaxID=261450 RepID=A0A835IDG9_9MAGN|nr:hypothetical protein IFM89_011492 [Coptis chinensis]
MESRQSRRVDDDDDEESLKWAALEKLPTYDRLRTGIMTSILENENQRTKLVHKEVDVRELDVNDRKAFIDRVFKVAEEDNEKFLKKFRDRIDRVGIQLPSVEVRMALLLGPPSSGKTTLLLALAAKLDPSLKVKGDVTYNGHKLNEFVPQKTSVYISQNDVHTPEMTVKETLDFSTRCQGVGTRYDLLTELARREKASGIFPDAEVDLFMKATAMEGIKNSLQTEEVIVGPTKTLFMDEISTGLDSATTHQIVKCMQQISHLTESTIFMSLLQPAPETFDLFDDIVLLSEGQIVYQGPRENVLEFFESCGFQCPERKGAADFLQEVTSRKDQEQYWADKSKPYRYISATEFVYQFKTSHIGLQLYSNLLIPYDKSKSHKAALVFTKYSIPKMDLLKTNFGKEWLLIKRNSFLYIFKTIQIVVVAFIGSTLFLRTNLHARNEVDAFIYLGALTYSLITNMFNGSPEINITLLRLPVFYKHRDLLFYPAWAFTLPNFLLRIPISIVETFVWMAVTYYSIGFAPEASRFFKQFLLLVLVQQMSAGLFKFTAGLCRTQTISNTGGSLAFLVVYLLGGFSIPRDRIPPWWIWGYWCSPLSYAYNAISVNELLAPRWMDKKDSNNVTTLGVSVLKTIGAFPHNYWFWIGAGALLGFTIVFNVLFTIALMYLDPLGKPQAVLSEQVFNGMERNQEVMEEAMLEMSRPNRQDSRSLTSYEDNNIRDKKIQYLGSKTYSRGLLGNTDSFHEAGSGVALNRGMVLPFTPLAMSFENVNYYVDMPPEMKVQGVAENRLRLLSEVSGAFRSGVLTALMGVSGAGKTTLLDVLAGRKTGGYIEGDIRISGFPKNQATFARVSGYCEQNDIHSPQVTVKESVIYSAFLRLPKEVRDEEKMVFVEEVLELVELHNLKDGLVGIPGISGLSTEQRKRLTIAVELVANPSIIFMDEPTSGLDARAAAIVMRTVRNTVNTGRTVVCTIHQPSIDIFEAFDEAIPGVQKIKDKYNPATWMLEVSSIAVEVRLGIDFAQHYKSSALYLRNKELVKELSAPAPGARDLYFPTHYSQPMWGQFKSCFWKQWLTYWRSPDYNLVRFFFTLAAALLIGTVFWRIGTKRETSGELQIVLGAMNAAVLFIGINNSATVQPIVAMERTVFYRERAAGMYSALPYAIAQVVTEIPYVFAQTTYYAVIVYAMMSFQWTVAKFFWFFFISFLTFLYFTYYGMMTVSITPNLQIASIFAAAFYGLFNLFSGFYIPRTKIPKWWIWYYWICPVSWTVYGLIVSQYGDIEDVVKVPGSGDQKIKDFVANYFGYDNDFMGRVAGVLVLYVVDASCLCLYTIRVQIRSTYRTIVVDGCIGILWMEGFDSEVDKCSDEVDSGIGELGRDAKLLFISKTEE